MTGGMVVMGVSGCGKSTIGAMLADKLGHTFIDGDGLHPPENIRKMGEGIPLTDEDRWPWLEAVGQRLAHNKKTIIACSALRRTYRDRIREQASGGVTFIHLTGSYDVLRRRMDEREGHFMPPSLLDSQLATLEAPDPDENAIAADIDHPAHAIVDDIVRKLGTKVTA